MRKKIRKIFDLVLNIITRICDSIDKILTLFIFFIYDVEHKSFLTRGICILKVENNGFMKIGQGFVMNNSLKGNQVGFNTPCVFQVKAGGTLSIGDNVGMSQTTIICSSKIIIGNNVLIGGGVKIYDTDFHSLNANLRHNIKTDSLNAKKGPIIIEDNVFIGAGSIVLKGVTVGDGAIIGAGSVVTKDIPSNEIWGGNPARRLRIN